MTQLDGENPLRYEGPAFPANPARGNRLFFAKPLLKLPHPQVHPVIAKLQQFVQKSAQLLLVS